MPTVTVLAWCLMASTGRVSSAMACASAAVRSSIRPAGVAILPEPCWYASSGASLATSPRSATSRTAVDASRFPSYAPDRRPSTKRRPFGASASRSSTTRASLSGAPLPTARSMASRASRSGRAERVDRQRGLVAEQVTDHRGQDEGQPGLHRRHGDDDGSGPEALLALGGDHDRGRLVGPEDRHLLGHVVRGRADQAHGADEDERLRRQVDVLLVLGDVAGDRLVAELAELDPDLLRRHRVRSVADHGPVAAVRREPRRSLRRSPGGGRARR